MIDELPHSIIRYVETKYKKIYIFCSVYTADASMYHYRTVIKRFGDVPSPASREFSTRDRANRSLTVCVVIACNGEQRNRREQMYQIFVPMER